MRMDHRRWWMIGGAAAMLASGVVLYGLRARTQTTASAAQTPRAPASTGTHDDKARRLAIPAAALAKNPITTTMVRRMRIAPDLQVVGSVSLDQDYYAIVGPLVSGRVAKLRAGLGDTVRAGQVLAELESSEVGQAQAAYLSARAHANAAQANLKRERQLAAERISSEREREMAEAEAISEVAELRAAVERLRAFGLGPEDIAALDRGAVAGGRVPLRAPIAGTVIARYITLGQAVERATDAFKIVNLERLWVLLDIYEKDLGRVHVGQKVALRTEAYPGEVFRARVAHVNPLIDEKTRTANVLIEFDNPQRKLRPGMFVTAKLLGDPGHANTEVLAVPRRAVTTIEGKSVVFVRTGEGFERRPIELGPSDAEYVEVRRGLGEGELVASDGAFLLKSELLR